jgi:cell division protein FtsL
MSLVFIAKVQLPQRVLNRRVSLVVIRQAMCTKQVQVGVLPRGIKTITEDNNARFTTDLAENKVYSKKLKKLTSMMKKLFYGIAFVMLILAVGAWFNVCRVKDPRVQITELRVSVVSGTQDSLWDVHVTVEELFGRYTTEWVSVSKDLANHIDSILKKDGVIHGHVPGYVSLLEEDDLKEMLRLRSLPLETQATLSASGE